MTDERRNHSRVPLLIEVLWEGARGQYGARTTDISVGGCFIDTMGRVVVGETIAFRLRLPAGDWIELRGQVMYELPYTGFGVRFTSISEVAQKRLEAHIKAEE